MVALKTGDGKLCTGTLVGPRVVATARHCFVNAETGAIDAAADVAVVPGAEPTPDSPTLAVQSVHTFDDGPYGVGLQFILDVDGRDLAALVLAEEITDITPRALFRGDPGDLVGAELTMLGFGPNAPNAPETGFIRRTTPFWVEVVSGVLLESREAHLCPGDSGGPALMADGRVLAVNSLGATWETCGDDAALGGNLGGVVNGVWQNLALFDDAAAGADTCLLGMPERCDDLDNDCDGDIDEDCDTEEDAPPPPSCAGAGIGAPLALLAFLRVRRRRGWLAVGALAAATLSAACGGAEEPAPKDAGPDEPAPDLAELLPDTVYGRDACTADETQHLSFVAVNASVGTPTATPLGITEGATVGFVRYQNDYRPFFNCDCGFPHTVELFLAPAGSLPPVAPEIERSIDVPRAACDGARDVILPLDPPIDVPAGFDLFVIRRFEAADEDPDDGLGAFGVCMSGCRGPALDDPSYYTSALQAPYPWSSLGPGGGSADAVRLLVRGYPPLD